jgi:hypothetical protein
MNCTKQYFEGQYPILEALLSKLLIRFGTIHLGHVTPTPLIAPPPLNQIMVDNPMQGWPINSRGPICGRIKEYYRFFSESRNPTSLYILETFSRLRYGAIMRRTSQWNAGKPLIT